MGAVTYFGHTVTFPALPGHSRFFDDLSHGRWDGGGLFRFLSRFVDEETTYIDVGAWLGVSPFWAAHRAKRVIAVEPDPVCLRALREMQRLNAGQVTVIGAAVSNCDTLKLHAVGGFGSSTTSALRAGGGGEVDARGVTLRNLLAMAGDDPVCMKIDIEGYEYHLAAQLAALNPRQIKAVLISLHPRFYMGALEGSGIARRWATAVATVRLSRSLPGLRLTNPLTLVRVLWSIALQKRPVHRDLIFVSAR